MIRNQSTRTDVASGDRIDEAIRRVSDQLPCNSFSAKVLAASSVATGCEEFNIWHANGDKAPDHLPWGELKGLHRVDCRKA